MQNYLKTSVIASRCARVCDLVKDKILTVDQALWFQACEGFLFLCESKYSYINNIRREIFKVILKGEERDNKFFVGSDEGYGGEEYSSLADKKLIKRMASELRRRYTERGFGDDPSPDRLRKILRGKIYPDRWTLAKLAFVLYADFESVQNFLKSQIFTKRLSVAVPRELILIYSLKNNLPWPTDLYEYLCKKESNDALRETVDRTGEAEDTDLKIENLLYGVSEQDFINKFLDPCYKKAVEKIRNGQQYSKSTWDDFKSFSIFGNKGENADARCKCFRSDTLIDYHEKFDLSDYDIPIIKVGHPLSLDMYGRFLTYRIRMANKKANNHHCTRLFSMKKYGELPRVIVENVFDSVHVNTLKKKRHLISRYDILTAYFYYLLMEHWMGQEPFIGTESRFIEKEPREIENLWNVYFRGESNDLKEYTGVNEYLKKGGFETFSAQNPCDALLKISLFSLCPLEVYTRIFELNVISSYVNDPHWDENDYPSGEHITDILDKLISIYVKLQNEEYREIVADLKIIGSPEKLRDLRERVSQRMNKRRI